MKHLKKIGLVYEMGKCTNEIGLIILFAFQIQSLEYWTMA